MQRAQTMLMAGWSLERVEAQFAWEEEQEAVAAAAAAERNRRSKRFWTSIICIPIGLLGWWLCLTGQCPSDDGSGTGSHNPGIIMWAFMAVSAWLLLGMLWRATRRHPNPTRREGGGSGRAEPVPAPRPANPGSSPAIPQRRSSTPSGPRARTDAPVARRACASSQPSPSAARTRSDEWELRIEALRQKQQRKSRPGAPRVREITARKTVAARSSETSGPPGLGQGSTIAQATPEGHP